MPEDVTPWWAWIGFVAFVVCCVALDLGVFHRKAREVRFKEALKWSVLWFALALAFAFGVAKTQGAEDALEFFTGYVIELSLSLDNVFVIALVFSYFNVPAVRQHRVLFWGILGALVMRGALIGVGVELIHWFHWIFYVFGVFLIGTGLKMAWSKQEAVSPDRNVVVRLVRKFFPVTSVFEGGKFLTLTPEGRRALTPLALVLLVVETSDLLFALDSIPAVFAVTEKAFIVFTSNIFAVLGLRSLYFLLAGAIKHFRYLKIGLAVVLIFVGLKMLIARWVKIPTGWSLAVVAGILLAAVLASAKAPGRGDERRGRT